jgi:hypothetical protein
VLIGDGRGGGGVHWGLGFSPGPKQGERRRPEPARSVSLAGGPTRKMAQRSCTQQQAAGNKSNNRIGWLWVKVGSIFLLFGRIERPTKSAPRGPSGWAGSVVTFIEEILNHRSQIVNTKIDRHNRKYI